MTIPQYKELLKKTLAVQNIFVSLHPETKTSNIMNPILLYPQNASQIKFFEEAAESKGVEVLKLPKEVLEYINDYFYGLQLDGIRKKNKKASREEVMAILNE